MVIIFLPPSDDIAGKGWQIWQGAKKITDPSADVLYSILQDASTQRWWTRHGLLSPSGCKNIDWDGTLDMMGQHFSGRAPIYY